METMLEMLYEGNKLTQKNIPVIEEQSRALMQAVPDLVFLLGLDGSYIDIFSAAEEDLFLPREDLIGRTVMEVLPPPIGKDCMTAMSKLTSPSDVNSFSYELLINGKSRWFEGRVTLCGKDTVIVLVRDFTEQRVAENELRNSEARFRDISESMDEWIWEVDAQGICTFVSEKIRSILGYSAEEVLGKTPFDFMPTEESQRVAGIFSESIKKKSRIHDLENWNLTKDGRLICMLTNGIPLLGEDGELIGYRGVDLDITDRKQAEEELKQRTKELNRLNDHLVLSEDNERKNLASELHDSVAQSLAMAVSQVKTIKEVDSGYGIETLSKVQKNIENAIKDVRILIHQLHPPILEDFTIDIVIGYLIETVNEKKQLRINYINNLTESVTLIETTKMTIYRAINELISNILKHSDSSVAEIELSKINNSIQIRIEDKGKGFEFDTYKQKNYCGFGLYSLSERIKNMDGELTINSSLGKGTKVILTVPVNV
jgi:PAS domain S-box-containing protein